MEPNQAEPRKQKWASWMCASAPWCLAGCVFGVITSVTHGWVEDVVMYGLVAVTGFALLSPLPWLILRHQEVFRLSHRMHSLQVGIWFVGWVGVVAALVLGLWFA